MTFKAFYTKQRQYHFNQWQHWLDADDESEEDYELKERKLAYHLQEYSNYEKMLTV